MCQADTWCVLNLHIATCRLYVNLKKKSIGFISNQNTSSLLGEPDRLLLWSLETEAFILVKEVRLKLPLGQGDVRVHTGEPAGKAQGTGR